MTRPHRNFRFKNKTEAFACVAFRYDEMNSLEYVQRKDPESIAANVLSMLKEKGADIISIRRIYLPPENQPTQPLTGTTTTKLPENSTLLNDPNVIPPTGTNTTWRLDEKSTSFFG